MLKVWTIVYTYKNKQYTTCTKECTREQALAVFHNELNSLNTFKLVNVF